jgi:hypothetical protein
VQQVSSDEDELLGAALSELAARRLRKNVLEIELIVSLTPDAAATRVQEVLADQGHVLRAEEPDENSSIEVVGMVGAGFANLNPAVVTVTIRPSEYGSRIVVRGAAKEGLIKQRAGESAARRVAAAIG